MKTIFFKSTLTSLVLALSSHSIAQSTGAATLPGNVVSRASWAQEPTSFIGLSIIEPIPLENCPVSKIISIHSPDYLEIFRRAKAQEGLGCILQALSVSSKKPPVENVWGVGNGSGVFSVFSYREVSPLRSSLRVHTHNGIIVRIEATFSTENYAKMKDVLVERYGDVHKNEVSELRTNGGVSFPSEKLLWVGKKVSLEVRSLAERELVSQTIVSSGAITITNNEWMKLNSEAEKSSIKSSAGKL